ncbi:MAG: hypothetical protein EPO21_01115 [Chloroflexota bacterium]|nr:MAG: hypothetical protein EPO21_01115 [Chloroflexota bacterium]
MKGVLRTLAVLLLAGSLFVPVAGGVVHAQMASPFGPVVQNAVSAEEGMGAHQVFVSSLAKNMGFSSTGQLIDQVKAGKSLRDIATAQGMDDKALAGAIRGAAQDSLNEMVSRGKMTKDEASTFMAALNDITDTNLVNVAEIMTAQVRMHMRSYGQDGERGMGGQGGQGM